MMNLISLFCGPGGFDVGFKRAGFVTKLAYDKDEACIATYRYNHPEANALIADLSEISGETIVAEWQRHFSQDVPIGVIGGPPCQSFSRANAYQSEDDPRHHLTEHYARIIKYLNDTFQLDFFVFENVPDLLSNKHRGKFERFKLLFEEAGFNLFEGTMNALHFGVPQKRTRIFVVGINRQTRPDFKFSFPVGDPFLKIPIAEVIGPLIEPVYFSRSAKGGILHPNHWCMMPKSSKFVTRGDQPKRYVGRSFRVLKWDEPSYTVAYGHSEVHIHPEGHRRLSVYEAMLLQGFPNNYVLEGTLTQQIRLVSEAVPPPVAQAIAEALKVQLGLEM